MFRAIMHDATLCEQDHGETFKVDIYKRSKFKDMDEVVTTAIFYAREKELMKKGIYLK